MTTFNRCMHALLAALLVAQAASAFSLTDLSNTARRRLSRTPPEEHPPPHCDPHKCPHPPKCYVNTCTDGYCDTIKVPDHTECYEDGGSTVGKCIDGHCELPKPECHPDDCPHPSNPCEKAICDGHECSTTHKPDHAPCHKDGKAGECVSGHCEVQSCHPDDCPHPSNPCEEAICDGHECSTTHKPDYADCHKDGKDGKCVGGHCEVASCHPDDCPHPSDDCKVAVCKNHACATDNAPDDKVCHVGYKDLKGVCAHGYCNPDYVRNYNHDDDDDGDD